MIYQMSKTESEIFMYNPFSVFLFFIFRLERQAMSFFSIGLIKKPPLRNELKCLKEDVI